MSVMNLDERGTSLDDRTLEFEEACACYDDDSYAHAPSEYVAWTLSERERLRRRDLNELQDLWREEEQRRKRERRGYYGSGRAKWHRDRV